jgi:hypothetical protein
MQKTYPFNPGKMAQAACAKAQNTSDKKRHVACGDPHVTARKSPACAYRFWATIVPMEGTVHFHTQKTLILILAFAAGCGSSSKSGPETHPAVEDASVQADSHPDTVAAKPDGNTSSDARADATPDAAVKPPAPDVAVDVAPESAVDSYVPGPVEPLVVNSGNTATYNLADGTWKVFSFDIVAGHFYCVGALGDGVDAYVGPSLSVSPSDYLGKTDYLRALNFTPYITGKYYIAVVANGGDAAGTLQIAEGGDLLELGDNSVTIAAPDGDNSYFFNFSIAPGHTYAISVTGDAKKPVTLGLSPLADRSTSGQFEFPLSTRTSALPITDEPIPLESVVKSSSRLYFIYVGVKETVNLTITVTLAS